MIPQFGKDNHSSLCDILAKRDPDLKRIIDSYGYPPIWTRKVEFASLVHIILEQQVSLASAKAAFDKLKAYMGKISPKKLLLLTDKELRECYFSRQKTVYVRELANAIVSKKIVLSELSYLTDEEVREKLIVVKGIGHWTIDIYLLFSLQRLDVFPIGDLALVNAMKEVKQLSRTTTKDELLRIADKWSPYRSIATHLLWHFYIKKRNIKY